MAPDGAWLGSAQIRLDLSMSKPDPRSERLDVFCPLDFYVFAFRGDSHAYGVHSIVQMTITCKNVRTCALYAISTPDDSQSKTEWRGDQCNNDTVANGVFGLHHFGTIVQFGLSCQRTRPAMLAAAKLKPIQARLPPFVQLLAPRILAPINLAPPQNWSVSMYTVNFQRKQPNGQWIARTTIPVGPAQAHSASGYTGWGTGGADGRALTFLSIPDAWRVNAQIASPERSVWSDWIEFGVMAPPTSTNALKPGGGFSKK